MSRPPVSVVMPFAGDRPAAEAALGALGALATHTGDELILADNAGTAPLREGVAVVRAVGERSPAHARNVGAEHASGEWILFLDADCRAPVDLLDAYFAEPPEEKVGALAGEVVSAAPEPTLASRYGATRGFLSQRAHLAHPYLPRAAAANLMVRREAFEAVGGFYEGVRAAEDTDFSWRLQRAGWQLELRPGASVEHRYRATVRELRRQWRGYAAGRAWLRRRYAGFVPEPALRRAARRALRIVLRRGPPPGPPPGGPPAAPPRLQRGRYVALDAMLALEELAGFALSNRPSASGPSGAPARVILVADRFPVRGDPLVDLARTLEGVRIEAVARPDALWVEASRTLAIAYREDDGVAARLLALVALVVRHPLRALRDLRARRPGQPALVALAPTVRRLRRSPGARVQPVGGEDVQAAARRLAALAGLAIDSRGRR